MAKFCRYCGRPLQEGETCTCREAAAAAAEKTAGPAGGVVPPRPEAGGVQPMYQSIAPAGPSRTSLLLRNLGSCFVSFFRDPGQVMAIAGRNKDIGSGLFFTLVNALLIGFTYMSLVRTAFQKIVESVSSALSSSSILGGLLSSATTTYASAIKIPYGQVFWLALVLSVCAYFALCGIGMLCGLIAKRPASYLGMMASVGVSAVVPAVLSAAALLFSFFWLGGAIFCLFASSVCGIVLSYSAVRLMLGPQDKQTGLLYGFLVSILFAVVFLIASHVALSLASGIQYTGSSSSSSLSGLFSKLA